MPLARGQSLTHYEILGPLGTGAMGEVYRARDTRLGREVALKVLPEHLADDEERLRRFEGEAQSLATLNHPNVAQVFGIDQDGDTCFMAMELVPGEDLAARLERGALPVAEALDVARQIAEGLEAAHEAGVVHRDLKPANVRVTPDGKVKVLDFGLAKAMGASARASDSALATEAGRVLGTPTYMAPEQARGKPIDKRVDVWAFGCVLYELLTAQRAFDGESVPDVLGAVLEKEPDLARLPRGTPSSVRALLSRCLDKDARRRLRDIGEARLVLEDPDGAGGAAMTVPTRESAAVRWAGWGVALVAFAVFFASRADDDPSEAPPARAPVRFDLVSEGDLMFRTSMDEPSPPALSPDGTRVALTSFTTGGDADGIFVHTLATNETRVLPGTARATVVFWSPDSREIGYEADGSLRRIELDGSSERICDLPEREKNPAAPGPILGCTWSDAGTIVFAFEGALYAVDAEGGEARLLLEPDPARGEIGFWWPCAFGGNGLVYAVGSESADVRGTYTTTLDAPSERKRLLPLDVRAVVASDHVLYTRDGSLFAQPFDAERRELGGAAVVVSDGVESQVARPSWGWFDASRNGRLVQIAPAGDDVQLHWVDRTGRSIEEVGPPGSYGQVSLSPDGQSVAVSVEGPAGSDVWTMDLKSGRMTRATTDPGDETFVAWSPEGNELVYTSIRDPYAPSGLRRQRLGVDEPSRPFVAGAAEAQQWLPDGRVIYSTDRAIWLVPADGDPERDAQRLLGETVVCNEPRVSKDGRWIAYIVNESEREGHLGDWQLFVAPFDRPAERVRVSLGGGYQPLWREDGGELVYFRRDGIMMSATIREEAGRPVPDEPVELFAAIFTRPTRKQYQLSADAQRVLVKLPAKGAIPVRLHMTLDWPALLR